MQIVYQFSNGKLPKVFNLFFLPTRNKRSYSTRFATPFTFCLPKVHTNFVKHSIRFLGPTTWS